MNAQEKLEAIRARIDGEWDNEQLLKLGDLSIDPIEDIAHIITL